MTAGRPDVTIAYIEAGINWHCARYGTDTRPPSAVRRLKRRGRRLSFTAPGDDWRAGSPKRYRIKIRGRRRALLLPVKAEAGRRETVRLPRRSGRVVTQAVDEAGNRGRPVRSKR